MQERLPSASQAIFPGALADWTTKIEFTTPENLIPMPVYRVMDRSGKILDASQDPHLSEDIVVKMYKDMLLLNIMDKVLYESQR